MEKISIEDLTAILEIIGGVVIKGDDITITTQGLAVTISYGNIKDVKMNPYCEGDFEINMNLPNFTVHYYKDGGFDIDLT